jgi:hypothetical protein
MRAVATLGKAITLVPGSNILFLVIDALTVIEVSEMHR